MGISVKGTAYKATRFLGAAAAGGVICGILEYGLFSFVHPSVRTGWSFYLGSNDLVYGVRGPWQLIAHKVFAFGWVVAFLSLAASVAYAPLYPLYRRLGVKVGAAALATALAAILTIEFFVVLGYYVEPPGRLAPFILFGLPAGVFFAGACIYTIFQSRPVTRLTAGPWFRAAAFISFGVAAALSFLPPPRPRQIPVGPNVIYITIDALRADRVGPRPDGSTLTPNIDAFAAEATTFTRCFAPAPWTLPSFATVFAGVPPAVHRAGKQYPLGSQYETLAELFSRQGYDTAGIVTNGLCEPRFGLAQGFAYYRSMEMLEGAVESRLYYTRLLGPFLTRKQLYFETTPVVERRSVKYLLSRRGKPRPFFLWIHFLDPHEPYTPPGPFMPEEIKDYAPYVNLDRPTPKDKWAAARLYDGEVRYVDDAVGGVLAAAKKAGLYDDAIIIISADHGEEFWEHGHQAHGNNLYDTVLHIPFIARAPGIWKTGVETDVPISSADLFGTVVEMCGLAPEGPHASGSFLRWDQGKRGTPKYLFSSQPVEGDEASVAVRYGAFKFISYPGTGEYELFDLTADPGEKNPQNNDVVAAGYDKIIAQYNEEAARLSLFYGEKAGSEEMVKAQLRALGYIQ